MIDLVALLVVPTVFLLVSPLSATPTVTVELVVILGLLRILLLRLLRLLALLASPALAAITLRLVLVLALALSPALGDGSHIHRDWARDHRVAVVVHSLTQFQTVGPLSALDEQVHPNGLWRLLDHDGTQEVL